jgi:hypothetical protein
MNKAPTLFFAITETVTSAFQRSALVRFNQPKAAPVNTKYRLKTNHGDKLGELSKKGDVADV